MSELLHFGDLLQIISDSGLGDIDDATEWLKWRGVCGPGLDQYATGLIDAAEDAGDPWRTTVEGIFTSGLTLGIAIAEASRASNSQPKEPSDAV